MELPKNITQIGEANHRCKIYVEDYVISYMKQLNHMAQDKDMAVALYGVRKEEQEVSYLFLYGACKLNFLQKETRHLSQAQQQEIEKCREKYFRNYIFLGYRLLNGDMIEGFHVCEQGICRYISGYAQFYEKNDSMLAYMLDVREEKPPEVVEQEKYDVVKRKQEERRIQHEEQKMRKAIPPDNRKSTGSLRGMRVAVVAVFALLCYVGLSSLGGGGIEEIQTVAKQVLNDVMEQQIPDAVTEEALIAEDKLADAILQENAALAVADPAEETAVVPSQSVEAAQVSAPGITEMQADVTETVEADVAVVEATEIQEAVEEAPPSEAVEAPQADAVTEVAEPVIAEQAPEPSSYIIKEGDTLIAISVLNYGNDAKVGEICSLNQIDNPDDIKVGQKILLP